MKNEMISEPVKSSGKYKLTEIGLMPDNWNLVSLEKLCSNISSGKSKTENYSTGSFPIYGSTGQIGNSLKFDYSGQNILIARVGANAGVVNYVDGKYCVSDNTLIVSLYTGIYNRFIYYILRHRNLNSLIFGSGQPLITGGQLKNLTIALPPLAEQTAIAEALSDADAMIASLEQLIEKKKKIKQGAMQELLSPTDANGKMKKGWVKKKLGEVAEIVMGQSPLSIYYNSNGIGLPLIQGNADVLDRKTIIRNFSTVITKKGRTGDIIMSVRAPVGEISKATFDCCLGRGVCAIRFHNDYIYHYLVYFENSWGKVSTGSTFDSVNSAQVKNFLIDIPKDEINQKLIAEVFNKMDYEISLMNEKLKKTKLIKQGMMQNLLTGKIRLV